VKSQIIRPAAYRVTTWRNGTGKTAEIAIEAGAGDHFAWRLSVADVPESGPFSEYADYERIIAVVDGDGMCLTVGDREPAILTVQSEPYAFSGDSPAACTLLGGPIHDFNLIFDPALVKGTVVAVRLDGTTIRLPLHSSTILIYAANGALSVEMPSIGPCRLPANTTLRIADAAGVLSIEGPAGGRAFIVGIDRP
jgi:environmental stress-induced protein Ves